MIGARPHYMIEGILDTLILEAHPTARKQTTVDDKTLVVAHITTITGIDLLLYDLHIHVNWWLSHELDVGGGVEKQRMLKQIRDIEEMVKFQDMSNVGQNRGEVLQRYTIEVRNRNGGCLAIRIKFYFK
jgi:hypothetical protein